MAFGVKSQESEGHARATLHTRLRMGTRNTAHRRCQAPAWLAAGSLEGFNIFLGAQRRPPAKFVTIHPHLLPTPTTHPPDTTSRRTQSPPPAPRLASTTF